MSTLSNTHLVHLATSRYLEVTASIEKSAANRHMRDHLMTKAQEWFPDKVKEIPPAVLQELIDNYAAGLMEVVDPVKNKVVNTDMLIKHVDKDTGKEDMYLESKLLTLLEGILPKLSQFQNLPSEKVKGEASTLVHALLSKGRAQAPEGISLVDDKGKIKPALLEHLLAKTFYGKVNADVKTLAHELTGAIEGIPANSSYMSDLVKVLGGGVSTQNSAMYDDMLKDFGDTEAVKNTLEELLGYSWYGPTTIPVDITRLDHTLTRRQATTLIQRLHDIDRSKIYKDKERLKGGIDRLPPYPGPREPWNKGSELLMARDPGSANFEIREGLHRFMSMMVTAEQLKQPKFSVSAYVYDRGAIHKMKKSFMDLARSFVLSLPASSRGSMFKTPQSLQTR
jgi:hypothetical protein